MPTRPEVGVDVTTRRTATVREAAQMLGVSPRHLYELIARGDFPVVRLGRRRVIPLRAIDEMLSPEQAGE